MVYDFIMIVIFAIAGMALIYAANPQTTKDNFKNYMERPAYPTSQLCEMPLTSPLPPLSGPADATLDIPRKPYHLLGDYMETSDGKISIYNSEVSYNADGQRLIEKTGTYGQVTNNYKRATPDNGTTLLHELSLSFYK